jgi:hypothetical protein
MIVQPSAMQRVAASVSPPETARIPIKLHAPDPVGDAAHDAAMVADAVTYGLLAASSPSLPLDARRTALEKLFAAWPSLCRTMADLEAAAPRSAAIGAEIAAKLRDHVDRAV